MFSHLVQFYNCLCFSKGNNKDSDIMLQVLRKWRFPVSAYLTAITDSDLNPLDLFSSIGFSLCSLVS